MRDLTQGAIWRHLVGMALFIGMGLIVNTLYMMIDRDRLRGGLYAAVPRRYHIRLSRVLLNLETIVGGYIRGQVLTSLLMAVFVGILLTACGVPNAIALAVFGGIADVLPYIGPFLTVGPAVIAASSKGLVIMLVVLGVLLAYEEFESRFLIPRIYGHVLRLPSSIVLIALLAGASLMGIVGALLALPVAAAIRMLFEELRVLRMEIARRRRVPPYVIFHDTTLREIARLKPKTKEELRHVYGVGDRKAEDLGDLVLAVVKSPKSKV